MIETSIISHLSFNPNWNYQKFRWIFENMKVNTSEVLPLLGANIHLGVTERFEGDGRPAASEDLSKYKLVEPGDIIMNPLGKPHGSIGMSTKRGITSPAYWVLRLEFSQHDSRFFHYLLRSEFLIREYVRLSKNLPPNQFDLQWEQFREIEMPIPPIEEQRRIADYLDSHTSQIDKILVTKEQQIDLLKEEVQTSFTGFFGHPIFSVAASKESRRLGPCLSLNEGGYWGDDPTGENDTLVLRSTEITSRGKWRELNNGAYRSLNFEFGNKHLLQRDDIVVTKASGSLDHIGKAALVTQEIVNLGASFGNFMQRLRVNREIFLPEYICHFLRSTNARAQFQYMGTTSTGLINISAELLNDLQVPVFSLSEQHHIVKLLEELESKFEARVRLIEESINLFEDLKLATISQAVTGKLMFETIKGLVNVR